MPVEKDHALECFERLLNTLARHKSTPEHGKRLWDVVADFCCIGSTSASQLCEALGLEPDLMVIEPVWVDFSRQAVVDLCSVCGGVEGQCDCERE